MAKLSFNVPDDVASSFKILAASCNLTEDDFFCLCLSVSLPLLKKSIKRNAKIILKALSKSREMRDK